MSLYTIHAPQLGEGVKSIKVVSFLKKTGEFVDKDEPLIEVETEKSTMEIESPVHGIVEGFSAKTGDQVLIGEKLITLKLLDQHAANEFSTKNHDERSEKYLTTIIADEQQILIRHMRQSTKIIPALLQATFSTDPIDGIRHVCRNVLESRPVPSSIEIVVWAVLEAMKANQKFCSTISDDDKSINQYLCASVGIAVSLPDDHLSIMKIAERDYSSLEDLGMIYRQRLKEVREGRNHSGFHTLSISDMRALHIQSAIPVIVSPAVATLCLGRAAGTSQENAYTLSLVFDHRLINGFGAAQFLRDIHKSISKLYKGYAAHLNGVPYIEKMA
jgi:pyruvate/2-oxoglutarate dehydrogenase complex dihydrolipoamide acyltransferase (E2) component